MNLLFTHIIVIISQASLQQAVCMIKGQVKHCSFMPHPPPPRAMALATVDRYLHAPSHVTGEALYSAVARPHSYHRASVARTAGPRPTAGHSTTQLRSARLAILEVLPSPAQ